MICQALQFTTNVLDQFLRNRFGLDETTVVMNNIVESSGAVPQINQNKIVISLINVEQETLKAFYGRNKLLSNGNFGDVNPAERFNLDLLVSSSFDNYIETLRFLDASILFFQIHTFLDATTFSSIPDGITRIELDIEKINYVQMQGLWTSMGAKYQPSIVYKMRLITYQGNQLNRVLPAIGNISNQVNA